MPRRLAAAFAATLVAADPGGQALRLAAADGGPIATGFVNKVFTNPDGHESPYVVFVPHSYDGKTSVPVVLFLHGAGETKGGKQSPVEVGIGPAIRKQEKTFPAVVVIPQAEAVPVPIIERWYAGRPDGVRAMAILDAVNREYNTDPRRTYLTGLSMGGYGTWSLAAAHPEKWAAIVPICGGGDPKAAGKIAEVPCWAFHGAKDVPVKVERSREMVAALKAAGGDPKYTEYPEVGHESWDQAYATPELFPWLFGQKRK